MFSKEELFKYLHCIILLHCIFGVKYNLESNADLIITFE
jgi:hypothetical protein